MTGPGRAVRLERVPAVRAAGRQSLRLLDSEGREAGRLTFQVCHACRLGHIETVEVAPRWQGQGLARDAVHAALALGPGYRWNTTRQSADGRAFFTAMRDEIDVAFPPTATRCRHMVRAAPRRGLRGLLADFADRFGRRAGRVRKG